jgi:hypothetical protein
MTPYPATPSQPRILLIDRIGRRVMVINTASACVTADNRVLRLTAGFVGIACQILQQLHEF